MDENQKKVAFYVGAALLVLLGVWLIMDKLGSWGSSITEAFTGPGETAVNEDNELPVQTSQLSYPPERYLMYADSLHEAMNYSGTDWTTIYGIIEQMSTAADLAALVNAYGTRNLRIFAIPSGPLGLGQSFIHESWIGQDGYARVNEIIANKGINFQF